MVKKKWTYENIIKYAEEYNITILSKKNEYQNCKSFVSFKCNKCNHQFENMFCSFKDKNDKHKCPYCSNAQKLMFEFVRDFIDKTGEKLITCKEEYINTKEKLNIKCQFCEENYNVTFCGFKHNNNRCPICSRLNNICCSKSITICDVREFIKENGKGDKLISKNYINNKSKLKIKCGKCNLIYQRSFSLYKRNTYWCNKCKGNKKYTLEEVSEYIKSQGDKLLSTEYINGETPLKLECGHCNKIMNLSFNSYKNNGRRCKFLSGGKKYDYENVKTIISKNNDVLITNENNYQNCNSNIKILCNECNNIYDTTFTKYITYLCPCSICNIKKSKGEQFIRKFAEKHLDFLEKNGLKFKTQITFDECKNKNKLPFDSGFQNNNNDIVILIEFDGLQHFEPVTYFGDQKRFEINQQNDIIKTLYCFNNKITLIRIDYTYLKNKNEFDQILIDCILKFNGKYHNMIFCGERYQYLIDELNKNNLY